MEARRPRAALHGAGHQAVAAAQGGAVQLRLGATDGCRGGAVPNLETKDRKRDPWGRRAHRQWQHGQPGRRRRLCQAHRQPPGVGDPVRASDRSVGRGEVSRRRGDTFLRVLAARLAGAEARRRDPSWLLGLLGKHGWHSAEARSDEGAHRDPCQFRCEQQGIETALRPEAGRVHQLLDFSRAGLQAVLHGPPGCLQADVRSHPRGGGRR
mmetsp:Transcript_96878/g.269470  ORF Transcript_96878/g.269470 Transcript_96878/m.269470 type:complete len:210 (-) Transcript_96878:139-768(-)